MIKFNLSRQEAEALADLLEEKQRPWPLDQLADELRACFGMVTKECEDQYKHNNLL